MMLTPMKSGSLLSWPAFSQALRMSFGTYVLLVCDNIKSLLIMYLPFN